MKKIYKHGKILVLFGIILNAFSSCEDFFQEPIESSINLDTIYSNVNNAERALFGAYKAIPYMFNYSFDATSGGYEKANNVHSCLLATLTDLGSTGSPWAGGTKLIYGGAVSPFNVGKNSTAKAGTRFLEHIYEEPYFWMRRAFLFIENVDGVPGATEEFIKTRKAEANLLVAISYLELIRRYGSVPWVDHSITGEETLNLTRPPLSELVDNVDALIVDAIEGLPDSWSNAEYGRLTKSSAYFLRSRLWMWVASPIFNTSSPYIDNGENNNLICMGSEDPARWEKAARITKEAIDYCESQGYRLVMTGNPQEDYTLATRDLFGNTEVVQFSRRSSGYTGRAKGNNLYGRGLPPKQGVSTTKDGGLNIPTQNLVDLYETVDGSTPDYSQRNPWEKLEPRFHATVIHDSAFFGGVVKRTYKVNDDIDYIERWGTGYFLRKFFHEEHETNPELRFDCPSMYMRLPELYLNYAEALNEHSPGNGDIEIYLNKTRERAGLPDISGLGQSEMREAILKERAVEFAFEELRFWDVRRRLIADKTLGATKYGVKRDDNGIGWVKTECEGTFQPTWYDKHYLYPFPDYEIQRGLGLTQNPGY